jgi:hypothetical protein
MIPDLKRRISRYLKSRTKRVKVELGNRIKN